MDDRYDVQYVAEHGVFIAFREVYGRLFRSAILISEAHSTSGEAVVACREKIRRWAQGIVDRLDAEAANDPPL